MVHHLKLKKKICEVIFRQPFTKIQFSEREKRHMRNNGKKQQLVAQQLKIKNKIKKKTSKSKYLYDMLLVHTTHVYMHTINRNDNDILAIYVVFFFLINMHLIVKN